MIGTKNILKITRHVMKRNKGAFDVDLIHPGREWFIGLLVSSALFLILGGYAGYLFHSQSKKLAQPVSPDSTLVEYKQEHAREVLNRFGERTKEFEQLRADRKSTPEPIPVVEETEDLSEDPALADDLTAS